MRTDCDWCGSTDTLSEHVFTEQGGGVETICDACCADSFLCSICTDISNIRVFGKLTEDQPDDICNDCYTKIRDAVAVLEGMTCSCGKVIDPMDACTTLGYPKCGECGKMYEKFLQGGEG